MVLPFYSKLLVQFQEKNNNIKKLRIFFKKLEKKQQHSNQSIKSKKKIINKLKAQLHHLNNHSFNITHLDLATQMK